MKKIRLKICGLKRAGDIALCRELGVDVVGLVTDYPLPVPWNLTAAEAEQLLAEVTPPLQSCLVTGGSREKILGLAEKLRPDYVQLHFRESLADAEYLAQALLPLGIGIIKTLPPGEEERRRQFGTADIEACVEKLNATAVHAILADARTPDNAFIKGDLLESSFFSQVKKYSRKPVIMAGGLTPENLSAVLAEARPDFIDIMTGVESAPGVKDRKKLTMVIKQLRLTAR